MNPEFWLENWKNNKIGFHQQVTNPHLLAFWQALAIPTNGSVFVPLCGKSLDLIWLKQQGHQVLGVELSELAVSQFFSENVLTFSKKSQNDFQRYEAESLVILQGDFFSLHAEPLQGVQGVFDRACLVALPKDLRLKYIQHLTCILPVTAKILLVTFEYDQMTMQGPPFSVSEDEVKALFQQAYEIKKLFTQDMLDNYPPLRSAGLTSLQENVYLLLPHAH